MVEEKELFYEKKLKGFYNERATKLSCLKLDDRFLTFLVVVSFCDWVLALVFLVGLQLFYNNISVAWYNDSFGVLVVILGFTLALLTLGYYEYIVKFWKPKVEKEIGILVDYLDDLDIIRIKARLREITKDDLDSFDRKASRLMGDNFANLLNTGMRMECSRIVLHDSSLRKLSKLLDVEIDDKLLCLMSMLKSWSNEKLINI